jgi:hypothetical protein
MVSATVIGVAAARQNLIAYLRVSSEGQDTQLQRDALAEAGCGRFFEDKISSRNPTGQDWPPRWTTRVPETPWRCGNSTGSADQPPKS